MFLINFKKHRALNFNENLREHNFVNKTRSKKSKTAKMIHGLNMCGGKE